MILEYLSGLPWNRCPIWIGIVFQPMSDTHSNAPEKLSDIPLEHLSDFDWNSCPICFRTGVRHELESLSDLACSTHLERRGLLTRPRQL